MERESAKAHRLCPVGISLSLSLLPGHRGSRWGCWAGAAAHGPPPGGSDQAPAPSRPVGATSSLGSKWLQMGEELRLWLLCVELPSSSSAFLPATLSSLKLSSWLSSSHSPLFSVHIHTRGARPQWTPAAGAHEAGDRPPVPMLSLGDLPSPPPGPAPPNLCSDHPLALCGMTLFSLALACPPSLPSLGRAGVVSRPAFLRLPQFLPGSFSSL